MNMKEMVIDHPLLAIMRNVPLEKTLDYAQALLDGGVNFFEIALNSKNGLKQISMLTQKFGDKALIGAGTAVRVDLAKAALDAGAQFLLTPSTPVDVLEYCQKNEVKFLPGVLTPTDVEICLRYGFDTLKLFPAGDMPRSYVKSLQGPFDTTNYVAIGGVTPENIPTFFEAGCIGVGLGSNVMPKEAVAKNDWETCVKYVAELVAKTKH